MNKTEMLQALESMLEDVLHANATGEPQRILARAHGYIDGYMRVLLDSGMASKNELLSMVSKVRTRVTGPALRDVSARDDEAFSIAS